MRATSVVHRAASNLSVCLFSQLIRMVVLVTIIMMTTMMVVMTIAA